MILFNALRAGYQGQIVTPAITGQLAAGSMTALVARTVAANQPC